MRISVSSLQGLTEDKRNSAPHLQLGNSVAPGANRFSIEGITTPTKRSTLSIVLGSKQSGNYVDLNLIDQDFPQKGEEVAVKIETLAYFVNLTRHCR